ncbi:uncharacterized protein [Miscanthus floridulus]|uniref:uncharacterized protein n=1 Tax=Miscanthus floridulus TaxID=154761 RepID=UPI00345A57F4
MAGERDAFRSRAREAMASSKVLAGQLGAEQSAHQLTKGALDEALTVAEASRTEAMVWRGKVEELGREASWVAEASRVEAQRLKEKVEAQRWKEKAEASQVEAQRWKEKAEASQAEARRWGQKAEELEKEVTQVAEASATVQAVLETEIGEHDALKSAARTACEALEAISDGYVLPDDDEEANESIAKLIEVAEGPSTVLAKLFEEEVVPPPPSADAGGPKP